MRMNRALAVLLIGALLLGGVFFAGYRHQAKSCLIEAQASRLASTQRAIEQANEIAQQDAEVLAGQELARIERRTVYRTLETERIKYVETHPDSRACGLDDDGLRQWNAANAGDLHAGPGQFQNAAAAPAVSNQRLAGRPVGESPGRGGAIPRLGRPFPPPGAGD
jgi:outer membrane murein-binding lipoprotein Lpp